MFNYYYYTNSYYMLGNILVLVGVALMALAQMKVSSAYNKYSKVQNSRHLTGYDVAREILDQHGLSSVQIFEVQGRLSALALATVVTALPSTPVHAESKQYWTESKERVGISHPAGQK